MRIKRCHYILRRKTVKNIQYILTIFKFHHNIFYLNLFHLFSIVIYLTAVLYGIENAITITITC